MRKSLDELNVITVELQGDTMTPISIFQKLKGKKKFLLESSLKHERSGRFSFIGADPTFELKGVKDGTILEESGEERFLSEKPLEVLKKIIPDNLNNISNIPFIGGAVGYVGYDVIRDYENIGEIPHDELQIPDVHLMIFEEIIVFDHLEQKVFLIATPLKDGTTIKQLQDSVNKRKEELTKVPVNEEMLDVKLSSYQSSMTREDFIGKVKRAKDYIVDGDIFQVVLSQRMKANIEGNPFSFYRQLRVQNPSPYMYYLDFHDYIVAGTSPESLIKVSDETITTNPIAGTRPRGKTPEADKNLENDLLRDEKELAEHKMLLDLGRNDIGRVSEFGSVQIVKNMEIEKYKHVMHMVSEVSGKLKKTYTAIDALIACLPAGTVSGAPKIRAMEIINELEELKRGIYSGAVGYLSANGNMDFALAIRTMVVKDEKAYIQAGAGIVHDSEPAKEYEETLHKLKAFLED